MSPMSYRATEYWSELHQRDDTSAVGQSGLPDAFNRWLYRILARNLVRSLDRHGVLHPPPPRMFEVGAGRGDWIGFWRARGVARVDGGDLIDRAVQRLGERYGDTGTFVVAEFGGEVAPATPHTEYPLVTVFNVLLHVTDDGRFARALQQVAALVQPGGWLVLVEPILFDATYAKPYDPAATSRARPIEAYEGPLAESGLERVHVGPAVVLANNPIEAGSQRALRRFRRLWNWIAGRVRRRPGSVRWLGPLLLVGDRIAMATGSAPSSKLGIYRRPIGTPPRAADPPV
jgi:SAM-dependent methyltransferase